MGEHEYITAFGYDPTQQNGDVIRERIVRCRDCEHGLWNGKVCDRLDPGFDEYWFDVQPDGFCAWGERMEVEA